MNDETAKQDQGKSLVGDFLDALEKDNGGAVSSLIGKGFDANQPLSGSWQVASRVPDLVGEGHEVSVTGLTPLVLAATQGKRGVCEALIKAGADPLVESSNRYGYETTVLGPEDPDTGYAHETPSYETVEWKGNAKQAATLNKHPELADLMGAWSKEKALDASLPPPKASPGPRPNPSFVGNGLGARAKPPTSDRSMGRDRF